MHGVISYINKMLAKKHGPCRFGAGSKISRECVFEGGNVIYEDARIISSKIGRGTYVGPYSDINRAVIGRYCSIGQRVVFAIGKHPISSNISTHPAFFSKAKQAGFSYVENETFNEIASISPEGASIVIGNDVWIGANVTILGGIRIGDGAVIGAGSVVTRNVDPYSIVAGIPAKRIKMRFDESVCRKLMNLRWWDHPEQWIRARASMFSDPTLFVKEICAEDDTEKN